MPNPTTPQAITDNLRNDVIDLVTGEIQKGIGTNIGAITDPAGFIASTAGAPPTLAFTKGLVRQVCRAWARGSTPIQGPLADGIYGPLCKPYLDSIGETPDAGRFEPSFLGGQCDGTVYQFVIRAELTSNPASFPINANGKTHGPITGWRQTVEGTRLRTYITSRSAVTAESCGVASAPIGALQERLVGDSDNRTGYNPGTFTLLGVCSGPDNCGNAPSGYLPPRTPTSLPPLPPYRPNIPGLGLPGIGITIDPDGNINVSIPDLGIDFTVDNPLRGPAGTGTGGGTPGGQGEPGDTSAPTDEEEEGEDPLRNLVGVRVNLVNIPPRANSNVNSTESYYKGLYYVFFGGEGGEAMNQEAAIVKSSQFFYAPKGCNKYRVVPNFGVTLTVQPFYEETE